MKPTDAPIENKRLKHCTVDEFLSALASDAMLPGAGAAGGVALALAAACAGKAVAITLMHIDDSADASPNDKAALENLQSRLNFLTETALILGENDALQLRYMFQTRDPADARLLLDTDYTMLSTCDELDQLLQDHEPLIVDSMRGDWTAARALGQACRLIHQENIRELE